jgi:hypothetical protein
LLGEQLARTGCTGTHTASLQRGQEWESGLEDQRNAVVPAMLE